MVRHLSRDPLLDVDLPTKVTFLRRPDSYPERPSQVDVIETHMSWVFMTDEHVYKLKKPVRHSFVNFGTLEARSYYCQEAIRLNRRLAEDVYLGVVSLTVDRSGELRLGGGGKPVESLVKMRRLPRDRMLDRAIEQDSVSLEEVQRLAQVLAAFYRHAKSMTISAEEYRKRLRRDIKINYQELLDPDYPLPPTRLEHLQAKQLGLLENEPQLFASRVEADRIIEAHGDLRPEHVCLTDRPVVIDCLEFNRDFRILDAVDELAYLAVECEYAGADPIGEVVLDTYRKEAADEPPSKLIHFHKSYRAALRARLSIWHVKDRHAREHTKWIRRTDRYLRLAEKYGDRL
jgi:aminoglycoside phosphotransferase family enzyme